MLRLVHGLVHDVAIDLIGADVNKAPQAPRAAVVAHRVEQPLRRDDVIEREARGICERVLYVRAGGEVHHAVDIVLDKHARHSGLVRQVTLHEAEVGEGV